MAQRNWCHLWSECWDADLIPGPALWVKDPTTLKLWPGPGTPYAVGRPKKKKKKKRCTDTTLMAWTRVLAGEMKRSE